MSSRGSTRREDEERTGLVRVRKFSSKYGRERENGNEDISGMVVRMYEVQDFANTFTSFYINLIKVFRFTYFDPFCIVERNIPRTNTFSCLLISVFDRVG